MNIIYLYIKTHNKTGLKYFGKTIRQDPFKYFGSGTRWLNHLKKHGFDVSTEIYGTYTDIELCKKDALDFSLKNDIVKSKAWANLKIEDITGGWSHITKEHIEKGKQTACNKPQEEKNRINNLKIRKGEKNGMYGVKRYGEANPCFGRVLSNIEKENTSNRFKNKVVVKDADGNIFHVDKSDEKYINGELKSISCGILTVKDKNGNISRVSVNDERIKSGELVSVNVGKHRTLEQKQNLSEKMKKLKWYNNGIISIRKTENPGDEWQAGRLKNAKI